MSNENDFDVDFEAELEESIAQIVDEETAGAEEYMRTANVQKRKPKTEPARQPRKNTKPPKKTIPHYVIYIIAGVLAILIIVGAILIGNSCVRQAEERAKDTYDYNNGVGYELYDQKDYKDAIVYFEKALTYDEAKNEITMRMYLYDCYVATGETQKAREILLNVLDIDEVYVNAIILLLKDYEASQDYESLRELYNKYKASENPEIVNLFAPYQVKDVKLLTEEGNYSADIEIGFKEEEGQKIYFTTNGEDPIDAGTLYESAIPLSEGSVTVKYYAANEYGFKTEVKGATYTVTYLAPNPPAVSPASGSYQTTGAQYVTISGVPIGSKAYYTMDGSTPTANSIPYSGPFELSEGNTTIKVIVYNEKGMTSSVTTATYTITKVDKYTDTECQEKVWETLIKHKYCNKKHIGADNKKYEIEYFSKKTIKKATVYMYTLLVGDEKQSYYLGCDANTGKVYAITKAGSDYILSTLDDYVEPDAGTNTEKETTAADKSDEKK